MLDEIDRAGAGQGRATSPNRPCVALALGGGGARGLAHIGVLQVLEREGIRVDVLAGSSMGGLIGALRASGLAASEIHEIAKGFRFPRFFIPGGLLRWDSLFPSAVQALSVSFKDLEYPLALTAVDLEKGEQVVLDEGPVLPAVRATCAVPGVLPPVGHQDRWLVDGGILNVLPVDVAWMFDPDVVIAVQVGGTEIRSLPQLRWPITGALSRLGRLIPNPATAKVSYEVLLRTAEIMLTRQMSLAAAMTDPEILIEPMLKDVGLHDFDRLDDAVQEGRRAAEAALPELLQRLRHAVHPRRHVRTRPFDIDPVCSMIVNRSRARATLVDRGVRIYFCSRNCSDRFQRNPDRFRTPTSR